MFAFRFRITFEDNDSFLRDVELASNQTFEDFHDIIVKDLKLNKNKGASFFLCDHKFRKQQEIALIDDGTDTGTESTDNDDPDEPDSKNQSKKLVMKESILSDLIDDPHQRLVYIYDNENNWTFYIELLKIKPIDSPESYPNIVKQSGGVPRELIPKNIKLSGDETSDESAQDPENEEENFPEIIVSLEDGFDIEEDRPDDESFDQAEPNDDKY